jgi:hypothetical protein
MIFSPVLSNGISEGSLNWLEQTKNLLNVAVTRARVGLFIVGDWEFCQNLTKKSIYRRLADYADSQNNRIFSEIDEIPLFRGEQVKISGYVLDPHNSEFNRVTLTRFLNACKEFIWWVDGYFDDNVVRLFLDILQSGKWDLSEIRLLTDERGFRPNADGRIYLSLEKVRAMVHEFDEAGIDLAFRVLPHRELPHDRLFFTPSKAINMPPFNTAYGHHKRVSEYSASNLKPAYFDELWEKAKNIPGID